MAASASSSSPAALPAAVHILPEIAALQDEIYANRRHFHAHPELSFEEVQTAAHVAALLRSYGIEEVVERVGRTGVVGLIRGGAGAGPCVLLRADMDALPITETAEVSYASRNKGVMHACGHDGHMAGLLAAARVLHAERARLRGTVKLVFQPAEEGFGGAREMIKDGVLEEGACGPRVDEVYGLHLWSYEPLGLVGCRDGPIMAASDKFEIAVKGRGGHGAAPHGTVDAVVEAAHLVVALQTVISRNKDPLDTGVLTLGTINGGYNNNIIADHVSLTGTCRSYTPAVKELIKSRMEHVCCGVAATFGGKIELDYHDGYPPTVNAYPEHTQRVNAAAAAVVGAAQTGKPWTTMGAEDFSFFLLERPGCFFFVGAALPGEEIRPHHKSVFDFDEGAMLVGASVFVQLIRNLLG